MARVPIHEEWAGRVIQGEFRLIRWLGGSEDCGVFLAEREAEPGEGFALKLMAAEAAEAENRTAGWDAALELDAPELLDVYGYEHCEIDGEQFVYVATEYAPEVLADVLAERALSSEEARTVLEPLVHGLEYLHRRGLVHGHLKPSNIMAEGDALELTVDHLWRVGETREPDGAGAYDAPELRRGVVTPAADVWSLGVTLVEMLTQNRPEWAADGELVAPEGLPEPFGRIARESLRVDPAQRCGLKEIGGWLRPEVEPDAAAGGGAIAAAVPEKAIPEPVAERAQPEVRGGMGSRMKLLIVVST